MAAAVPMTVTTTADPLAREPLRQALRGDARAPGVQEGGRHRGEDEDDERRDAEAGLHHDEGDVALAGVDGRAHADHVHPAGDEAVGQGARRRGGEGLFGLAGVVAHRAAARKAASPRPAPPPRRSSSPPRRPRRPPASPSKKMTLQSTSVRMKSAAMAILFTRPRFVMPMSIHRRMSAPMTRHQTQAPVVKDAVRGQGPVVDHDGRPAHQLEDVQKRKEQPALLAEGHLHRLHGAAGPSCRR